MIQVFKKKRWLIIPLFVAAIYTYQSFEIDLFVANEPHSGSIHSKKPTHASIDSEPAVEPEPLKKNSDPQQFSTERFGDNDETGTFQAQTFVKEETTEKTGLSAHNAEVLLDVPHLSQLPELQRGCEVTSLAMMLQYAGVDVGKMELAERIHKVPYRTVDGYRGNPYEGFVGNIYTFEKDGYAAYHKPVADLAEQFLQGRIEDLTGQSFQNVLNKVKQGSPVVIITNSRFRTLPESEFRYWKTRSGDVKITWREHAVVLTGYSDDHVYINNPLGGKNVKLDKQSFIEAWEQLGSQAISYN